MVPLALLPGMVKPLCSRANVSRLALVGSAARNDFDPAHSDVDFLVDFKDIPGFDYFGAYMTLRRELASLVGHQIDLISVRSIENPYLQQSLTRDARELYAA
ncbi:MAG: nucleotidyltransferase domain-containing protein [Planctomycetes bacterium]|nr:nucleotidyltransferase domain-containing protein [Planctomycetota bacterium]